MVKMNLNEMENTRTLQTWGYSAVGVDRKFTSKRTQSVIYRNYWRSTTVVVVTFLLHFVINVTVTVADRSFTKVYEPIDGTLACFKRLNGTQEIGCRCK